jgi:lipoprotein NlpD
MSFYHSKLNFLGILVVLTLLNVCNTEANYSPYGYQRLTFWNKKSSSYNVTVGRKVKLSNPDPEDRVTGKKQKDTAAKYVHKKQHSKLDGAKKSKKQQQKSIASIDNKKMLELNFGWPIKGRVLKRFSPSHNKGIDIAGKRGQPIKATEAGKVVYGGQGLIGFGKLLIIKHNDDYLSAYANNSRLLVHEGQHVSKGQVIAEVGGVGIKRTSLHFEIRKNGKPVNPLKLLPKK